MTTVSEHATSLLSLEGKIAMVTGAASGIGRAIALKLSEMGAATVVLDINAEGGSAAARTIAERGGKAHFEKCDVRSSRDCKNAVEKSIALFGRIDILCNNAGVIVRKSVVDLHEDEWDLALDVTLKGIFLLSREVIPHMEKNGGGAIINTGSGWSLKGGPQAASYCAAKAGVLNLTRAMAIDHGKATCGLKSVCARETSIRQCCAASARSFRPTRTHLCRKLRNRPLARVGTPEVRRKRGVSFLASGMASWITGAQLVVDGGGLA